jgi:hypothetical protein
MTLNEDATWDGVMLQQVLLPLNVAQQLLAHFQA